MCVYRCLQLSRRPLIVIVSSICRIYDLCVHWLRSERLLLLRLKSRSIDSEGSSKDDGGGGDGGEWAAS